MYIFNPKHTDQAYANRFQSFQNLMKKRINDILLVSSPYDLYLFEEDGRLYENLRNEYQGLHLSHSPEITRVSGADEALQLIQNGSKFDLIITTLHIEDSGPVKFANQAQKINPDIPIILLAFDSKELQEMLIRFDTNVFKKIFIWSGDFRLIIAIVKFLEDRMNVEHDTQIGVQSVIVIEDNIRNYSAFLPIIYTELIQQSKRLISEGINLSHKYLRMRARPKIILCSTFEEAWEYFEKYEEYVLGVISDIDFIKEGKQNSRAGLDFASEVKKRYSDIPILLQSADPANQKEANEIGASFLHKDSPSMLQQLRDFMVQYFHFGDFIFRLPDGSEISRASDLTSLEENLKSIPAESIQYHGERNHFSNWLKARTEFWLADKLRPQKVTEFKSTEDIRNHLITSIQNYRKIRQRGVITDFKKESFDPTNSFARIGGGSLGGKARGLSFLNILINNYGISDTFEGIQIDVPPAVVVGTDVFDQFLEDNKLRNYALNSRNDNEIKHRFLDAKKFPSEILEDLKNFLELVKVPLSVRSSSLLEDSLYHPFAGVYDTFMIPNNHENPNVRSKDLLNSIKLVYASTFYNTAKSYIRATSYRLEEEKMAVIVQKMVGSKHNNRFYPDFSGVTKSYNYYPIYPLKPDDGITSVALGLGITIVEGGKTIRFCPKYPNHVIQFHSTQETLSSNQKNFYALDLDTSRDNIDEKVIIQEIFTKQYDVSDSEEDGTLNYVGSTYSLQNDTIYDGISGEGYRLITFAPILKYNIFPLPDIIRLLLEIGSWGMASPVEIEFAVNLSVPAGEKKEFGVLQMRPMVVEEENVDIQIDKLQTESILCKSNEILGSGITNNIYDLIYVDNETFDRSKTRLIAQEINRFNSKMLNLHRPYILIGIGRWGTLDPWLGIPVTWGQICGAKIIVEAGMPDLIVEPSQGSHFFQNLTSFSVGYFTVNTSNYESFLDWKWLHSNKPVESREYVRHLSFDKPLITKLNAHRSLGVILKY